MAMTSIDDLKAANSSFHPVVEGQQNLRCTDLLASIRDSAISVVEIMMMNTVNNTVFVKNILP